VIDISRSARYIEESTRTYSLVVRFVVANETTNRWRKRFGTFQGWKNLEVFLGKVFTFFGFVGLLKVLMYKDPTKIMTQKFMKNISCIIHPFPLPHHL